MDWDIHPRRPLRDREQITWNDLKGSFIIPNDSRGRDRPIWKRDSNGVFKTSTVKEALFNQSNRLTPPLEADKYKKMWKSHIPKKCKFFQWTLSHRSINTMENLQRKLPSHSLNLNWCILCQKHNENMDHIFIRCNTVFNIWSKVALEIDWHNNHNSVVSLCREMFENN